MANGGNLDWCIIGAFDDYPDRSNFKGVREVFSFHERYQDIFDHIHSAAKVLLIQPNRPYTFGYSTEYRGIFKMLKESHIPFDTLIDIDSSEYQNDPTNYDLIIIPGIKKLRSDKLRAAILSSAAKVIATGGAFSEDTRLLNILLGINSILHKKPERGAYFLTEPKDIFKSFPDQDWIYLDKDLWEVTMDQQGSVSKNPILPLISPAPFGPPEKCYGHKITDTPGAVIGQKGVYISWEIGTLYYTQGFEAFKKVFLDLFDHISDGSKILPYTTDAHRSMEILFSSIDNETDLLQLINLSGYDGIGVSDPVIQKDIHINFKRNPSRIEELTADSKADIPVEENALHIQCCNLHKAYLIHYNH